MQGRVFIVAGSDSGGGAGIQADIKTVTALGGYAMTALTALTAQNTQGVFGVHPVPADFVRDQITVTLEDLGCDVVKTGMLAEAPIIEAVVEALDAHAGGVPWVVDPVMVAKGGQALLDEDAVEILKARLVPRAAVLTPNLPEAEALTGAPVRDAAGMQAAALVLLDLGARAVLLKGGHLEGDTIVDLLATEEGCRRFEHPRIDTPHTHGTGCTLASAIAVGLAQGMRLGDAVMRARAYVLEAIRTAPGYGSGHGPLDHGHPIKG